MIKLKDWLKLANRAERKEFAAMCGTTMNYLTQVANGHRNAGQLLTLKMYASSLALKMRTTETTERLPTLHMGDINEVCAQCPFYVACMKTKK